MVEVKGSQVNHNKKGEQKTERQSKNVCPMTIAQQTGAVTGCYSTEFKTISSGTPGCLSHLGGRLWLWS